MRQNRKIICVLLAVMMTACWMLTACKKTHNDGLTDEETVDMADVFLNSMQKSDPAQDDEFNILLVGNSGFYYFIDELYGLLKSAGIKANVCNLYVGSSTLSQHWNWLKAGEAKYQYRVADDNGCSMTADVALTYGIKQHNWDVIGLCDGSVADHRKGPAQRVVDARDEYLNGLLGYFRKEFPMTKLYWQQNSAYQVGYNKSFLVTSFEDQQADCKVYRDIAKLVSQRYDIGWVPRGDAAQLARENPVVGDVLTARIGVNDGLGDLYHDGDIGGGQYLTASVWFEVLTGESCVGNTFRPDYALSEDKITALQKAAHEAVLNMNK